MNEAEKVEAIDEEERCIQLSLARSRARVREALDELARWELSPKPRNAAFPSPPPRDVNQAAFDLQLDVLALYRVRVWRQRFG